MIRQLLNRLFGRTDSSIDAINAYVEGNASADETNLVEQMMRSNPALEKDLATQKALLGVLGRIEKVEAPRSFAVTPEMVAAAESSESGIFKLAELFAPQRKLAMAPAIIAGFAALTVALLTIGDITGTVEQSDFAVLSSGQSDESIGVLAEPGNAGAPGNPGEAGSPELESAIVSERAEDAGVDGSTESSAAAATAKPAAAVRTATLAPSTASAAATARPTSTTATREMAPAQDEADAAPQTELMNQDSDAGQALDEPPGLVAEVPVETTLNDTDGNETSIAPEDSVSKSNDLADAERKLELTKRDEGSDALASGSFANDGSASTPGEQEVASAYALESDSDDGIKLPLRQLQIALGALALAAFGAWAGLRKVRRV